MVAPARGTHTVPVAYVTCPGCQVPQMVGDDLVTYQCFTCYMDVRFHTCPNCGLAQSVLSRWSSYTCGRCQRKIDRPHRESYPESTKATRCEGVGYPYPKL